MAPRKVDKRPLSADCVMKAGVTRANWRTHPHSVWAFQNLGSFLPVAEVHAADFVRPLQEKLLDLSQLCFSAPDGEAISWAAFLEATHTDAMIVLHRGAIVFEHYANGMRPETPHMLFSITKSLVGLLAEMLIADGVIEEEARAATYVPELEDSAFGQPTIRSLLDMRDGIRFDENYPDPDAQIHLYSAAYWGATEGGVRATLPQTGSVGEAGSFAYRTPVTDVVGWCIVRAAGKPLAALLSERIWSRIGAEAPALWVRDTGGHEIAATGLNSTLRDVGRLAQMLVDRGCVEGVQVIERAILDRIAQGGDRAAFARSEMATRPGWSYRSHWWVPPEPGRLCALGVFGQRVLVDAPSRLAVVRFGSHPTASNAAKDEIHDRALDAIRAYVAMQRP
jgi:CubicO group peptidase (beta-lactamase class C family)